jgi:hypothetical protein
LARPSHLNADGVPQFEVEIDAVAIADEEA